MGIFKVKNMDTIAHLFKGWEETLIWSCLEGWMGSAYTDDLRSPESAQLLIGDFCFFGGKACRELVGHIPQDCSRDLVIMIPQSEDWSRIIKEIYKDNAKEQERYAIKKEYDIFDEEKLERIIKSVPNGYVLHVIDQAIYNQVMKSDWARDLCAQFADYEDYRKRGMGVAALKNGQIVSGASSYGVYSGGIEIEIDTQEEERRKGLALCCGAMLILKCLKQKKYPSWDAQNKGSVALAEKLGYHFDKAYPAFEIYHWNEKGK